MKEFIVDTITKESLSELGFNISNVDDTMMNKIANDLGRAFREQFLREALPIIAEWYGIPYSNQDVD